MASKYLLLSRNLAAQRGAVSTSPPSLRLSLVFCYCVIPYLIVVLDLTFLGAKRLLSYSVVSSTAVLFTSHSAHVCLRIAEVGGSVTVGVRNFLRMATSSTAS